MYKLIKMVIENKDYELSDILRKIEVRWINGDITQDEKSELAALARDNASAKNSVDIFGMISALDERVRVLEESSNTDGTSAQEYVSGKIYYAGDIITFGGKTYICTAPEGAVCVWSPQDYPAYWKQN